MTAKLMLGRPIADRVLAQVKADVAELGHVGLATILVGEDPASEVYIGHKQRAANEVGIEAHDVRLAPELTQEQLIEHVKRLNDDDGIDGILVQLPLPNHVDEALVAAAISPLKDVDGLTPTNAGLLYLGRPALVPATPVGIMALLDEHRVELQGKHAVVVGRSDIVGKPIAHLLLQRHATVTICHSRTAELARFTSDADVLVAAVGTGGMITREMVKRGATVVDVGITRTQSGLVGDVEPAVAEIAAHLTPVPGGVGPTTIAMLLANTVYAARLRRSL